MEAKLPEIRADVAGFLAFLNAQPGPKLHEMSLEDARGSYTVLGALAEADPRPLAVIRDLSCPGPGGPIPLRLYDLRENREPGPVVMFFHGGGFVIGDLDSHHALCTEIAAELDLPVIAVHYRRAPEAPFPAAADDTEAASRWVAGSPAELGRTVTGLIPLGDSAGGNLTLVTSAALAARPAAVPVVLQVPLYPATDESTDGSIETFAEGYMLTAQTMDWFMASYAPAPGDPRAYPLSTEAVDFPPTILVTAGLDPLRDQGRRMAAKLTATGVDVNFIELAGTIHGFATLRKALPSAHRDIRAILAAVRLKLEQLSA